MAPIRKVATLLPTGVRWTPCRHRATESQELMSIARAGTDVRDASGLPPDTEPIRVRLQHRTERAEGVASRGSGTALIDGGSAGLPGATAREHEPQRDPG